MPAKSRRIPKTRPNPLRIIAEILVLILVVVTPWCLGSTEPVFVLGIAAGIALLMICWSIALLTDSTTSIRLDRVTIGLLGLIGLGLFQLVPLPGAVIGLVSPQAAELRQELYPAEMEQLPDDVPPAATQQSLSLYPEETRSTVWQLLLVLMLFLAVRHFVGSTESFKRLAYVCLANGTALAVVGIGQSVSGENHQIYWSIPTNGSVFGPFVNRNHFAMYANLTLGLSIALLIVSLINASRSKEKSGQYLHRLNRFEQITTLFKDPWLLWVSAGTLLILISLLYSLSRGGFLAMLIGLGMILAAGSRTFLEVSFRWMVAVIGMAVGAALFMAAFGYSLVRNRLGTLQNQDIADNERLTFWSDFLPLADDYLLFGSGYGSFPVLEPTERSALRVEEIVPYAHNEYLEAIIEGGLPRLVLTIFIGVMVFRLALRSAKDRTRTLPRCLALGGAFSILTLLMHSIGEFGIHLPAIAVLATVIAGQLCASDDHIHAAKHRTIPLPTTARIGLAIGLIVLGLLALNEFWSQDQAERHYIAALNAERDGTALGTDRRVQQLESAVKLRPGDAELRQLLGKAYLDRADQTSDANDRIRAMRAFQDARNLLPLLAASQAQIGLHTNLFRNAEPSINYLERAIRLRPGDAELWYAAGLEYWNARQYDNAWQKWRHSLTLDPERYLEPIVERASQILNDSQLIEKVLPADAHVIMQAGEWLHPESRGKRRRFDLRALEILTDETAILSSKQYLLRAKLRENLRVEGVAADYRSAVLADPGSSITIRLEYIRYLGREKQYDEALKEIGLLVASHPTNQQALDLQKQLRDEEQQR